MPDLRHLGSVTVIPLCDATGTFPLTQREAFGGASEQDWARLGDQHPRRVADEWWLPFRCYAVVRSGAVTLVDTGVGPVTSSDHPDAPEWTPTPGRLPALLAEHGLALADVDTVVLTHLHEDHVGWAVVEGRNVFDATYLVQAAELASVRPGSWVDDRVVRPLEQAGRLEHVSGEQEIAAGLRLVPTPGHSPGHQAVLIEQGGDRLWLAGDAIVHELQLVNPQVRYRFDADPVAASRSRTALLSDARQDSTPLGTAHLLAPWVLPDGD